MTKVLVTGGRGFIGGPLVKELEERGYEVAVLDRDNGDIRDYASINTVGKGADHVIHLAGVLGTHELFDTPQLAVDVNITGSLNVLKFCKYEEASYTGITMPQVFPSIYTATKIATTAFATAYHHTHGVPVSHVRAFNAFGPGQHHGPGHPQKIIPTFATNIWTGTPIPVWGDGEQTVDLIHTSDLARMLADAILFGDDVTFDGGTGEAFTVNEVIELVAQAADRAPYVEYLPMRRGEIPTNIVATGEGWDLLGWAPEFRFHQLVETVESYKP